MDLPESDSGSEPDVQLPHHLNMIEMGLLKQLITGQAVCSGLLNPPSAPGVCWGSQEGGRGVVLLRDGVGLEGKGAAVNSRHAIRERPHVCTISGIRRERGRGRVGDGGGTAVTRPAVC